MSGASVAYLILIVAAFSVFAVSLFFGQLYTNVSSGRAVAPARRRGERPDRARDGR